MILPNIRTAALAGAFLTLAIVMGEFTIANLSAFHTFPIYIQYVNETQGVPCGGCDALQLRDHLGRDARRSSLVGAAAADRSTSERTP